MASSLWIVALINAVKVLTLGTLSHTVESSKAKAGELASTTPHIFRDALIAAPPAPRVIINEIAMDFFRKLLIIFTRNLMSLELRDLLAIFGPRRLKSEVISRNKHK